MAVVESMPSMETNFRLPTELDEYMQESIYHMVGFCSTEEKMKLRVTEAKEEARKLQGQVRQLQERMRELEFKCAKSREEAVLNAQALRRQVAECQKLSELYSRVRQECSRLENECQLYQNDREVFMEAADEAEERAAEADERASEADTRASALLAEIERLKRLLAQGNPKAESGADSVAGLRLKITQLEADNARLHKDLNSVRAEAQMELGSAHDQLAKLGKEKVELVALVSSANERYREFLRELTAGHDGCSVLKEVGLVVNGIVTSAATSGVCRAMEQENRAAASDCKSLLKSMKKELFKSRARLNVAEERMHVLSEEVEKGRGRDALARELLETAQADIQRLEDENKVLRLIVSAGTDTGLEPKTAGFHRSIRGGRPTSGSLEWHKCMERL